jgi:predicted AAA+ superfamily ATPase
MAITNQERIGKALELCRSGLAPFVEREINAAIKERSAGLDVIKRFADDPALAQKKIKDWDVQALLRFMKQAWQDVFDEVLGRADRSLLYEINDYRNNWAHQHNFTSDDTDRALDSIERLLTSVSAEEADEVRKMKLALRRTVFEEQSRSDRRRGGGLLVESAATGTLTPWREVTTPHKDVASGNYQQAEFAADLWQVHLGEGSDEYRDPQEFFRRTYLTQSLSNLLANGVRRLGEGSGDPVVELQTNFGGGKTHSMLALFHLFSGTPQGELLGVDELVAEHKLEKLPDGVRRVVLVGNKISPGRPTIKDDGTEVRTLWGELAWQLGGREAYDIIRQDDERATSPGDALRTLMNDYGPCLILIDEWVAYARQLHDDVELPGGNFETHFSFAQALTESAKLAKNCMLVISLPASDSSTLSDDEEVGGVRGRAALARLKNVIGRVESSWSPATTEEGFEIVRRRLFEPMVDREQFTARDNIARAFADLYRTQHQEFPLEARGADYEQRLRSAYPIHPEVFDRLYSDWSTLPKFQRTRGVLRLMAAVIHSLYEKGDRNPLIMPGNIPVDDARVRDELTRYLPDQWKPIIEKDVDGPSALPLRIDGEVPNLGRFSAARRVARTVYLGSAPMTSAANRGIEDRHIKLGCVIPGETPAVFGDALRRLASAATYLYQDGNRYWYSTQPTVTKLAEDRAEQLRRDPDKAAKEIEDRLRADLRQMGDFVRVHPVPESGGDVPDDMDARLVVLRTEHTYSRDAANKATAAAEAILQSRGNAPRLFQNTLTFLAADEARLVDLDESVCRYLAWKSILAEKRELNLDPHQETQAENQLRSADGAVNARIPETYQWLLVPVQTTPSSSVTWEVLRLTGQEPLALRASKKMRGQELLFLGIAGTRIRMELDRVPLWRGDHVEVRQLIDDFARYLYLPRLRNSDVLTSGLEDGLGLLLWRDESFAYADSYDADRKRYLGLRGGERVSLSVHESGLIVKPPTALKQLETDTAAVGRAGDKGAQERAEPEGGEPMAGEPASGPTQPTRFFGTVSLDPSRVGRDAARIADEVIAHLAGLVGAKAVVSLEIEADIPEGVPENVVRTVSENARTLNFSSQEFERD